MTIFRFIDQGGHDVTNGAEAEGYSFVDYFDCPLDAPLGELAACYLGPDCAGIGVEWKAGG